MHKFIVCFLVFSSSYNVLSQIIVDGGDDVYQIRYRDRLLFDHSPDAPILSIGEGEANFEEMTGNFEITENITRSYDLIHMSPSPGENFTVLQLSSDEVPLVSVTVTLSVQTNNFGEFLDINIQASADDTFNRLWCRFAASPTEKVYGGGEQYTYFNLRNHTFPIWTREQGVGRDGGVIATGADAEGNAGGSYDTTYWPQASFMSDKIYSMFLTNYDYLEMNFENPDSHEIFIHSLQIGAHMYVANTVLELVPFAASSVGRQANLPDWVLKGSMLGLQGGTDEMMYYYELARNASVDVSALWIQDWSGKVSTAIGERVYWNWKWNETWYPGLDLIIPELAAQGVQVGVYCNDHLIVDSELYNEADRLGYLMTDSDGNTFDQDFRGFFAATVDIHNEEAANWYRDQLIKNIIDLGVTTWMADFGEYTRTDMISKNTQLTPEEIHNSIPVKWAQINKEIVEQSGTSNSSVYFMRAGAYGSSANQVLSWAGDQNVDFSIADGVASTVVAALSLSVSGMGVTHFDIGGYTTLPPLVRRSEELFLRSAEYAVFTPVMRTHEGSEPDKNHQFYTKDSTLNSFARLTNIHTSLFPYIRSIVDENSKTGMPTQRPMFLHYENDPQAWDLSYQYLFGPDLIVAPIIDSGEETVELYIPDSGSEQWIHLFTGDGPYFGPTTLTVQSSIGYPAVLYRNGSSFRDLFESITAQYGNNEE